MLAPELQEWLAPAVVGVFFAVWLVRRVRQVLFPWVAERLLKRGRVGAAMWFRRHAAKR